MTLKVSRAEPLNQRYGQALMTKGSPHLSGLGPAGRRRPMAMYLGNAFSLQMLPTLPATVRVEEVSAADVPADVVSVVGHPDTAAVLSGMLGFEVPYNRVSISLQPGDVLYVAQVVGGRLPEGATTLPEGFKMKFLRVVVE